MRPTADEVLRGVQRTLLTAILPAIDEPFLQGQVQVAARLLDSLAREWDTEAQRLLDAGNDLEALLRRAAPVLRRYAQASSREEPAQLALTIDSALDRPTQSIAISALSARLRELKGIVAQLLILCEQAAVSDPDAAELMDARRDAYRRLRDEIAARPTVPPPLPVGVRPSSR